MTKTTVTTITCPACEGVLTHPLCHRCDGIGTIEHERRVVMDREESRTWIEEVLAHYNRN